MLEGKHAFVSGGGSGIGLSIAQHLAAQGAQVTIAGRRADLLARAAGPHLFPCPLDVRDEHAIKAAFAKATAEHGPIQICVANAGVLEPAPLHRLTLDRWRATLATNLDGAFLTIQAAMHSMRHTDWGRVITIASLSGRQGVANGSA